MSKKMTEEQKLEAKEARRERDRGYHARIRERSKLIKELELMRNAGPLAKAVSDADGEWHRLSNERIRRRDEIRLQIAELEKLLVESDPVDLEAAASRRFQAWNLWREAALADSRTVDEKFPDLVGVWGPGGWKRNLVPAK